MTKCLFLGDSITDADHLFDPEGLGHGYVRILSQDIHLCTMINKGQNGFTIERIHRMMERDLLRSGWDIITILAGVNDVPVEVYTSHKRIPDEFYYYYNDILTRIRKETVCPIILMEPFLFDCPAEFAPWHKYITMESRIIRSLARKHNGYFIPTDSLLRKAACIWGAGSITPDGIHLTALGDHILADLWKSAYHRFFS